MISKSRKKTIMNKKTIEVVAAIIEKNDKYFIAQRPNRGELALKWEFPGGKVEPNESREDALIREIREEFKSDIKIKRFIETVYHEYQTFHIVLHCYLCELVSGDMELIEHVNKLWVRNKDLDSYDLSKADLLILPIE